VCDVCTVVITNYSSSRVMRAEHVVMLISYRILLDSNFVIYPVTL